MRVAKLYTYCIRKRFRDWFNWVGTWFWGYFQHYKMYQIGHIGTIVTCYWGNAQSACIKKRGKRKKKETPEFLMQPLPYVRVVGVVSKRHSFSPLMDSMVFCLSSAMWLCCKKSFSKLVSWVKARAATRFMLQFDRSRLTNCGIISKALDSTFWSGFRSKCKERR